MRRRPQEPTPVQIVPVGGGYFPARALPGPLPRARGAGADCTRNTINAWFTGLRRSGGLENRKTLRILPCEHYHRIMSQRARSPILKADSLRACRRAERAGHGGSPGRFRQGPATNSKAEVVRVTARGRALSGPGRGQRYSHARSSRSWALVSWYSSCLSPIGVKKKGERARRPFFGRSFELRLFQIGHRRSGRRRAGRLTSAPHHLDAPAFENTRIAR